MTGDAGKVAAVTSFYMAAALVMVFVNKATLNANPGLPLLFIFIQLVIAVLLLHASAMFTKRVEIPQLKLETAGKLFPCVFVNIVGLVFNTLCLRDVEASFFQIARGLVLPLTIIASSVVTRTKPGLFVIVAASIVAVGFVLGIAPTNELPVFLNPRPLSLFYGFLSALFIAIHAVLIKSSLSYVDNSTIQLAYWTNLGSAAMLLPVLFFNGELSRFTLLVTEPAQAWDWTIFAWGSLVTGVFGYLLCVAGLLSIKVTSPVTHMFSSAVRSCLQTILGVWIFGDMLTMNRVSSILVILLGTMYYTWVKSRDSGMPRPPPVDAEKGEAVMMQLAPTMKHDAVQSDKPE